MRAVARWRFMSSDQVICFLTGLTNEELSTLHDDKPWAFQQVLRRLFLLSSHHFLDLPPHQVMQLAAFAPFVYGLGREGARLLAELGDPIDPRLQWTTKNSRATSVFLLHTLETTEVMLSFDQACRSRTDVRLIDQPNLLPHFPTKTRDLDDPFRLRVTIQRDFKNVPLNVIPDRLFSFAYPDNTGHHFALEIDRGTMDVGHRSKRLRLVGKSTFKRKLIAYFEAWKQERHREQWGFRGFRVLTCAPSETRVHNMIEAQRQVTNDTARGLFLYTTPRRLADEGAFGPVWMSSETDGVSLLDRK
ncbi:MAG: replication-relaxation family protein [Hyphomicrobium sp.]